MVSRTGQGAYGPVCPSHIGATALTSDGRERVEVAGRRFCELSLRFMSRPGPESAGPPSPLRLVVGTPGHGSASIRRRHEPFGVRRHGATELHYGAPDCTDSRQRLFLPSFLPKEAAQRSRDIVSPGHSSQIEGVGRNVPAASQADSAGSIPVTRSMVKRQVNDVLLASLGLSRPVIGCGFLTISHIRLDALTRRGARRSRPWRLRGRPAGPGCSA